MPPTQLSSRQINTKELFSVRQILLSRGFEVLCENNTRKLLLTEENLYDEIWKSLYNIFLVSKFRKELKGFLYKKQDVKSEEVIKVIHHPKFVAEHQRFNNTFEWFAGELMLNKFAAFSYSFGVSIRDIMRNTTGTEAGDYDSLVVLRDTNLAFFECKAGSFDGIAIMKCYERMLALNCEYSILFCVENINEEKLIWESQQVKIPVVNLHFLNKISIRGREQDVVYEINNCYVLDMSGDIENKIRTVLRVNSAKINSLHTTMSPDNETFNMLGYNFDTIGETRYQ
ncbi:MAG: hypothetical protein ACR2FN_12085 [Chitinophagaceae bacterium]